MWLKLISILATLATIYNDWRSKQRENKIAEEERNKIEKEETDEADRIAALVTDIRNDPDLSDELLIKPEDRSNT